MSFPLAPSQRSHVEHGNCLDVLPRLAAEGVLFDAVITDPPYHLTSIVKRFGAADAAPAKSEGPTGAYERASRGFMGQTWDGGDVAFRVETWRAVFEVMKPGAYLVAFSGTRTYHRMACAIEDAGFEIRDSMLDVIAADAHAGGFLASLNDAQRAAFARVVDESGFGGLLAWMYGSGFPKSHDVAKAIDKAAGHWCGRAGATTRAGQSFGQEHERTGKGEPVTAAARQWEGWGTAIKPAFEPMVLARKPFKGSVAANVLEHGTGALNIDGCRIGGGEVRRMSGDKGRTGSQSIGAFNGADTYDTDAGRWPANVIHDGSPEVEAAFARFADTIAGDPETAARFFYSAKASPDERIFRCDACGHRSFGRTEGCCDSPKVTSHPTVKPIDLMRWLCRLVTPTGGLILDPFAGSGTTGAAALREGFRAVLIEQDAAFAEDARQRLAEAARQPSLLSLLDPEA